VGTIPPNPVELLFSERLQQLISELRQEFDMVFLDCPPVDIVADASVISRWADLTVFVVRTGLMERDLLPVVEGFYREKRFSNMSILLNGTPMDGTRYGSHRYGYGYGYGYGGYTKEE
jgi:Mrp family chromosome partitioning ATPase